MPLRATCKSCGRENDIDARFCQHCRTQLSMAQAVTPAKSQSFGSIDLRQTCDKCGELASHKCSSCSRHFCSRHIRRRRVVHQKEIAYIENVGAVTVREDGCFTYKCNACVNSLARSYAFMAAGAAAFLATCGATGFGTDTGALSRHGSEMLLACIVGSAICAPLVVYASAVRRWS
jgi:hypothetical protein